MASSSSPARYLFSAPQRSPPGEAPGCRQMSDAVVDVGLGTGEFVCRSLETEHGGDVEGEPASIRSRRRGRSRWSRSGSRRTRQLSAISAGSRVFATSLSISARTAVRAGNASPSAVGSEPEAAVVSSAASPRMKRQRREREVRPLDFSGVASTDPRDGHAATHRS